MDPNKKKFFMAAWNKAQIIFFWPFAFLFSGFGDIMSKSKMSKKAKQTRINELILVRCHNV